MFHFYTEILFEQVHLERKIRTLRKERRGDWTRIHKKERNKNNVVLKCQIKKKKAQIFTKTIPSFFFYLWLKWIELICFQYHNIEVLSSSRMWDNKDSLILLQILFHQQILLPLFFWMFKRIIKRKSWN